MTRLELQIKEPSPSVKDALFRRLLFSDDVAWLRDEKKKGRVTGFEVDLERQELSGFALIAIQRHTVIAFVSDRDEAPRLILFPTLETLFDPGFGLLDLMVTRKEFKDGKFVGAPAGHGRFGDMVKDMTPPDRKVDIPETVITQMSATMEKAETSGPAAPAQQAAADAGPEPVQSSEPEYEDAPDDGYDAGYEEGPPEGFYDAEDDFDSYEEPGYGGYDEYEEESGPEPSQEESGPEPSRSGKLKAQAFGSLSEVTDYAVRELHVNRALAVTLVNKAMQSKVSPEYRIQLAVNIFCKLIDENRI